MAAVALPRQMHAGLYGFLGLVGALHAHVIVLGLADLLMELTRHRVAPARPRTVWDSLEGGRGLSSSTSLVVTLPVLGSTSARLTCFFGIFACALSALAAAFSALRMGFSSARVRPFFLRKAQARFLNQTIPPA